MVKRRMLIPTYCKNLPRIAYIVLGSGVFLFIHTITLYYPESLKDLQNSTSSNNQCYLPHPNPWDRSIMSYIFKVTPLNCTANGATPMVRQDELTGKLMLASNQDDIACRYRKVFRGDDDFSLGFSDDYPIEKFPFDDWPVDAEFLEVSCAPSHGNKPVFTDIFSNIRPIPENPAFGSKKKPWSVLIIGIDSVSRSNFVRSLPNSLAKLKELGAVFMNGYNKVGENTFPNMIPILTGQRWELDPDDPPNSLPHDGSNGKTFDDYPLIWKKYKEKGFATLFAEDMPKIGTFIWQKKGFRRQPTDHYVRTMYLALQKFRSLDFIDPFLQMFEANNLRLTASPTLCWQGRTKHAMFWNYAVRQFVQAYSNRTTPYFGLTWLVEPSHDHVNMVSILDNDLSSLLDWLYSKERTVFNETFVFVMSDHGARFDSIRNTLVGRIEDRTPFFSVILPESFKLQFPELVQTFKSNSERLTTPLDFHQTLNHIQHLGTSENPGKRFDRLFISKPDNRWSASLMAEVLPSSRTCWQAGVLEQYCACYNEKPVAEPSKQKYIRKASQFIINQINSDLASKYQPPTVRFSDNYYCSKFEMAGVESASRVVVVKHVFDSNSPLFSSGSFFDLGSLRQKVANNGATVDDYVIAVKAEPGGAIFEAHVVKGESVKTSKMPNEPWKVVGEIQRINAYGNQSWCIHGSTLAKKFCYCVNTSERTI